MATVTSRAKHLAKPPQQRPALHAQHTHKTTHTFLPSHSVRLQFASIAWALLPLLSFGLATPAVIGHAAHRLKSAAVGTMAIAYGVILAVSVAVPPDNGRGIGAQIGVGLMAAVSFVGCAQAFIVRNSVFQLHPYRGRKARLAELVATSRCQRQTALEVVAQDPPEALRLRLGRIDIPESERFPDGGLIDMNNSSAIAISERTGLEAETAERLATHRRVLGGFESVADMCGLLGVTPQSFDAVEGRLIFLPYLASKDETATSALEANFVPLVGH